jgi:hypothetical protein
MAKQPHTIKIRYSSLQGCDAVLLGKSCPLFQRIMVYEYAEPSRTENCHAHSTQNERHPKKDGKYININRGTGKSELKS